MGGPLMVDTNAPSRSQSGKRILFVAALLLSAGSAAVAMSLVSNGPAAPVAGPQRISLPFEDTPEVWEFLRGWVIQEDGRNKPFDTFCREAVRAVTGRERFEEVRSRVTGRL